MPMKAKIEGTPSSSGRPPALLTDQHDILKSTPHPVCLYFHTKETDFLTKATLTLSKNNSFSSSFFPGGIRTFLLFCVTVIDEIP